MPRIYFNTQNHPIKYCPNKKIKIMYRWKNIILVIRMINKLKLEIRHDNINVAIKSINQNQNVDKHRNHNNSCEMEINI